MRLSCLGRFSCWMFVLQLAAPASAEWMVKRTVRKPAPAVSASNSSFAGYIRRLTSEARAAAERGDLESARTLAERAHKVSLTCKSMLNHVPDCSPQATEALVREFTAAPPSTAVAQTAATTHELDLSQLLDEPNEEPAPPIPPAPAPEIAPIQPQRPDTPRAVKSVPAPSPSSATQPATSDPLTAMQPRPRPLAKSPGIATQPSQLKRGTMHSRSDAAQPRAAASPRQPARRPLASHPPVEAVEEDVLTESADEPEVTTAIGDADNRWELDVSEDAADASWNSRPQLDDSSRLPDESVSAPTQDGNVEPGIGIWSAGSATSAPSSRTKQVVSLSDFLDPTTNLPARSATSLDLNEPPRMIETDFRPAADSLQPRTLSSETVPARSPRGPAVSFREDVAADWTDSAATPRAISQASFSFSLAALDANRKVLVLGVALVLSGCVLFGLSFRRT